MTVTDVLNDPVDQEAHTYEQAAVEDVTGELAAHVAEAVAVIAATWATLAAGEGVERLSAASAERLTKITRAALRGIVVDLQPALERQAAVGFELGQRHAVEADPLPDELDEPLEDEADADLETADPDSAPGDEPDLEVDDDDLVDFGDLADRDSELADVIDGAEDRARDRLDEAAHLVDVLPMTTKGDVDVVSIHATAVVNGARRDATWVANRAQSLGVMDIAHRDGLGLIWLSERDSCLACLALSGQVAYDGEDFPDVTFADKPLDLPAVPHPPRHPGCRCRCRPYDGPPPTDDLSATDVASVLAREARRSVLRGWSAYDSQAARLRAADQLIANGANLPRSVIDRALRNIAAGELTRDGGTFPAR